MRTSGWSTSAPSATCSSPPCGWDIWSRRRRSGSDSWTRGRHSTFAAPTLYQLALAEFLREGHHTRHVRRMRGIYRARRDALLTGLARHCGDLLTVHNADAGLHVAALLPHGARRSRRGAAPGRSRLEGAAALRLLWRTRAPERIAAGVRWVDRGPAVSGHPGVGRGAVGCGAVRGVAGSRRTRSRARSVKLHEISPANPLGQLGFG